MNYLEAIRRLGFEVVTDQEEIYWDEMFGRSATIAQGKDNRLPYEKKLILIRGKGVKILIEPDPENRRKWWAWNNKGEIIVSGVYKQTAIYMVYQVLMCKE